MLEKAFSGQILIGRKVLFHLILPILLPSQSVENPSVKLLLSGQEI